MALPTEKLIPMEDFEDEYDRAANWFLATSTSPLDTVSEMPPPVNSGSDVETTNKSLRAVAYWRAEKDAIRAQAKAEIERIQRWAQAETERIDRRISWHERGLFELLKSTGKKSMKYAYGTLKWIVGRERVEVEDKDAFLNWARSCESRKHLIRVKEEPDKVAIGKFVKDTGEIPDGVDLVTGDDNIKIEIER